VALNQSVIDMKRAIQVITDRSQQTPPGTSLLVGVSGIDASGRPRGVPHGRRSHEGNGHLARGIVT